MISGEYHFPSKIRDQAPGFAGGYLLPGRRELRANRAEGRLQLGPESIYNGDDSDRNSRSN